MMDMKSQFLWNVGEPFSVKLFTKHCQQMMFKYFTYGIYHIFNYECLKKFPAYPSIFSYFTNERNCIENVYQMFCKH